MKSKGLLGKITPAQAAILGVIAIGSLGAVLTWQANSGFPGTRSTPPAVEGRWAFNAGDAKSVADSITTPPARDFFEKIPKMELSFKIESNKYSRQTSNAGKHEAKATIVPSKGDGSTFIDLEPGDPLFGSRLQFTTYSESLLLHTQSGLLIPLKSAP